MCGIFAYIGKQNKSIKIVFQGLKDLEYRGYDSWGIAAKKEDGTFLIKKQVGKISSEKIADLSKSHLAVGHTRWATHGKVTVKNSHPQTDCFGKIAVVHNGIVENYEKLKRALLKKGHKFTSDTDTEVICHLIEEYNQHYSFTDSVRKAFLKLKGLNAFIATKSDSHKIIAIRNGSPLVIGIGAGEKYVSSDTSALIPYTKNVYFLKDNELSIITEDKVIVQNILTKKKKNFRLNKITYGLEKVKKGNFPNFMLKEICEQPTIISDICMLDDKYFITISKEIKKAINTYLVGCGSASYACLAGSYLFSKICQRQINWAVGSEFVYHLDFLNKNSLVIALSQSGETIDILEAVKKTKQKQAKICALVNVTGSSLYREADYKMLLMAGPEKAVATTKAFTAKLTYILLVAYFINKDIKSGKLILKKAIEATKKLVKNDLQRKIRKIAQNIKDHKSIYVIGRGLSYPAALETALKIKEISYIHAEGFAAGELKHGVIALIEKETPCIAFLPNDETYGANLAGAMELKARGGKIIGVSHKKHQIFDYYIPVDDCREATIIPNVVFGQLLAYYLATSKGYDPDKPRNLAKSVTVK